MANLNHIQPHTDCTIVIYEAHDTEEYFGDGGYDSHMFHFEDAAECVRFRELIMAGQELAKSYEQAMCDVLLTDVLSRGDHISGRARR